jgi:hypothetical protein
LPPYDIRHMAIQQYDSHNKVSNGFHLSKVQTLLVVIAWAGLSALPGIFMSTLYRDAAAAWRITLTFLLVVIYLQPPASAAERAVRSAMNKLFQAFVGDWAVRETFQMNEFFPKGGERKGMVRFRVGTGGTSLIEDYHSDGSAGRLDFLLVIWWNAPASTYQVFTCSSGSDNAGQLRGSAHWEQATLVNEYVEKLNGKDQNFQDRFSDLTSAAFTLVAGIERNGKTFLPLITTTYRRKVNSTDLVH